MKKLYPPKQKYEETLTFIVLITCYDKIELSLLPLFRNYYFIILTYHTSFNESNHKNAFIITC